MESRLARWRRDPGELAHEQDLGQDPVELIGDPQGGVKSPKKIDKGGFVQ